MEKSLLLGLLVVFGFLVFAEAANNCWLCDANVANCKDSNNWSVVRCNASGGTGGPDLPCYKVGNNGNRGCATAASCLVAIGTKYQDFDWASPITYLWYGLIANIPYDCFSPQMGCHDYYCCRDQDRCNSSTQLKPAKQLLPFIGLLFATVMAFRQ